MGTDPNADSKAEAEGKRWQKNVGQKNENSPLRSKRGDLQEDAKGTKGKRRPAKSAVKYSISKEIHDEMYDAYEGICMYCASWTPRTPRGGAFLQTTIDHYIPKSVSPHMAYQWSNFRLSRSDLNTRKGIDLYVPDPFGIQNNWFEIDFATWHVRASDVAPDILKNRARSAFVRLGLNEDFYIEERQSAAAVYVHWPAERDRLSKLYPFLTAELERQTQGTDLLEELRELLPRPAQS